MIYTKAFKRGLEPTPRITVSEWADLYRYIPKEGGAKEPGKWRTSRFPFTKEIMDCMSPFSDVNEVVIMKGTQLAITESSINVFGHTCHIDPAPIMMLLPTIEVAKRHSQRKVRHTIEQTPVLKERVASPRERDSDNTILMKGFPGGSLIIAGANSAASLRNVSVKKLILDEVDAYELDLEKEGDTVSLAMKRTDAFGSERKIMIISTPTISGFSKIEKEFQNSDQRYYYVPCPYCGHYQYLRWKDGDWKSDGEYRLVFTLDHKNEIVGDVKYRCESCKKLIPEHFKSEMLAKGEWRPHNVGHRRRGYHLSSLYSPLGFLSWKEIAQEFCDAYYSRDIQKLKTWKNTRLAETWDEEMDSYLEDAHSKYLARREAYGPIIPMPALLLTAGVDVQRDRIEINVAAWGYGEECWNMEYRIIPGAIGDSHVQQELDEFLLAPRVHTTGAEMRISRTLIDSGDGVNTQEIYDYVRPRQKHGFIAAKGSQYSRRPIIERSKKITNGVRLYMIGTDTAKDSIYYRLSVPMTNQPETRIFEGQTIYINPMAMHFNLIGGYDEEYFLQLFSEVKKVKKKGGRSILRYEQIRRRNEALDCAVLCLAGLKLLKPDWRALAQRLTVTETTGQETKVITARGGRRILSHGLLD